MAKYDKKKKALLLKDEGIVRNRLKINAAVENAKAFLLVQKEFGSFDKYIWQFVNGKPIRRGTQNVHHTSSPESNAMSADLRKRGFKFVGTTICYAFMQAVGMINDHSPKCFRVSEL